MPFSAITRLLPDMQPISYREQARSAVGALIGIFVTGLIGVLALSGSDASLPFLVAPMGASSVLLFAVPSSPLAQPWSILAGNISSALVGVTVTHLLADPVAGAALAAGLAIAVMISLRCLHPPSGAIALTAVLGGKAVHDLGYFFVLWPVAANSLALLGSALLYNRLVGRRYPHRHKPATAGQGPSAAEQATFHRSDLDAVLKEYDAILDIDPDDLEAILRRTELRAYRRRTSHTVCGDIMIPSPHAHALDAPLTDLFTALRESRIKAIPITDDQAAILGIVTQSDLIDKVRWARGKPVIGMGRRMTLAVNGAAAPNGTARDIMTTPVKTVTPDMPLSEAIGIFAETGLHHLPVVSARGKLIGMLAQTDVLLALMDASRDMKPVPEQEKPLRDAAEASETR
ncbi:HPP family protein [Rhizobium paknamense]|uniref:CBS domain-containing membrane protein n=1 Tax=Rhizobium paknamense TaxID=1206817 RepID=A0ABU0IFP2_9HYPH|nr:HPP family protein [Rhizobium paknamense]MDQ0457032.1 CBS domain-containing membrane protein [Rhizobium paknamense]